MQPIFNPVGGYASYIVPAAFVLILQQVLLIGAALLTVVALAQPAGAAFANVLGRGVAHLTIFLPALALYLIVLPRFYGFSTLGQPLQLLALASLFTLATSFMGQAAGAWFKHPETPTLIFIGISLAAVLPDRLCLAARGDPQRRRSPWAMSSRLISRSTASFASISWAPASGRWLRDWRGLWCLAVIYFALAVISAFLVKRRQAHG